VKNAGLVEVGVLGITGETTKEFRRLFIIYPNNIKTQQTNPYKQNVFHK